MTPLVCDVAAARKARGWSQAALADRSGVSRAEVSAIETGRVVPSTAAALRLAAALEVPVERLFRTGGDAETWAWPAPQGDRRAWRATIRGRTLLYPVEPTAAGTLPHDVHVGRDGARALASAAPPGRTLVVAGCDPMVSLLARELSAAGVRLLPLVRSSRDALELLRRGLVHVAGVHLAGPRGGAHDALVRRTLGTAARVVHLMQWETGVALGRARRARSIGALLGARVPWVNREEGSGARRCLDALLGARRPPSGYDRIVGDHRAVAATVASGWAEAGICIRPVAEDARLGFLPVQREAYELCYPEDLGDDPRIAALETAIRSATYRQLVDDLPGCSSRHTGDARRT